MENAKIFKITDSYSLFVANSLERYRCETFFSKEPETIEWINTYFEKEDTFYDVGANIGVYSIYAAIRYPNMSVLSFEPYINNYWRLCQNINLNNVVNIIPLNLALSDSTSIEEFFIKDERVGSSGNQIGENIDENGQFFETLNRFHVPCYSFDNFIKEFSLPIPNHIKIDVDGVEDKIVAGMKHTLLNSSLKSILVEINHNDKKGESIIKLFQDSGFSIDKRLNALPNHSRNRRKGTASENAENIIYVRSKM
jgi:FkbM family methyltransferase